MYAPAMTPLNHSEPSEVANFGVAYHSYHGDDAVGYDNNCIIVADGVSGTKRASGVLARALVQEVQAEMQQLTQLSRTTPIKSYHFRQAMNKATRRARQVTCAVGRLDSTLSVVFFDVVAGHAFTYTLGDCKCIVLRDNTILYESCSIVYDFNVPAVVSTNAKINCTNHAHIEMLDYKSDDIWMVFSDGIGDNLFADEIVGYIPKHLPNSNQSPETLTIDWTGVAQQIVDCSRRKVNTVGQSIPFAVGAHEACAEQIQRLSEEDEFMVETIAYQLSLIPKDLNRKYFGQEKLVKKLNYYSLQHLLAFAQKESGKEDDISICIAQIL